MTSVAILSLLAYAFMLEAVSRGELYQKSDSGSYRHGSESVWSSLKESEKSRVGFL